MLKEYSYVSSIICIIPAKIVRGKFIVYKHLTRNEQGPDHIVK